MQHMQRTTVKVLYPNFCRSLPIKIRSTIPYWIIEKFPREWQAHLEMISDYILGKDGRKKRQQALFSTMLKKTFPQTWYLITTAHGVWQQKERTSSHAGRNAYKITLLFLLSWCSQIIARAVLETISQSVESNFLSFIWKDH